MVPGIRFRLMVRLLREKYFPALSINVTSWLSYNPLAARFGWQELAVFLSPCPEEVILCLFFPRLLAAAELPPSELAGGQPPPCLDRERRATVGVLVTLQEMPGTAEEGRPSGLNIVGLLSPLSMRRRDRSNA